MKARLIASLLLGTALGFAFATAASADDKTVKIGVLTDLSANMDKLHTYLGV